MAVSVDQIVEFASALERTDFVGSGSRRRLRVGSNVYAVFSEDDARMGFAYPKEERDALVASDPTKFKQPREGDLKYNWVVANLGGIEMDEAEELLTDAWGLVVPRFLFKARLEATGIADGES